MNGISTQAKQEHLVRQGRIASAAAEMLIRSEGEGVDAADQYLITPCQADDHTRDCIRHLCFEGRAAMAVLESGHWLVELGEFPPQNVIL